MSEVNDKPEHGYTEKQLNEFFNRIGSMETIERVLEAAHDFIKEYKELIGCSLNKLTEEQREQVKQIVKGLNSNAE